MEGINRLKSEVAAAIRADAGKAIDLSHRLHARPELGFQEHYAVEQVTALLEEDGFRVDRDYLGLETAFSARVGEGWFLASILAEYDALPEIGHACGHNMIAATAVLAARGLRDAARELDLTIEVLGTPAEESEGGKILLAEKGAFDGVQMAMMVHPAPFEDAEPNFLASSAVRYEYYGRSSHAAAAPAEAINAADAATLAQVAVGLLRQQLPGDVRVHAMIERAGTAVNVIPGESSLVVDVRAQSMEALGAALEKVDSCFFGAALATGCEVIRSAVGHVYPNVIQSPPLAALYRENITALGRSFSASPEAKKFVASTDFGAVSHLVRSLHPHIAICDPPVANHQVAFAEAAVSPRADDAIVDGAIAMAWTVIDAATAAGLESSARAPRELSTSASISPIASGR